MIKECIILAGGLGTRLRSEVADLPKCMAPVAEKPFLHWVITNALLQGVTKFIFSLGYLHEKIEDYIAKDYPTLNVKFSIEDEPLGTGGAIKLAMQLSTEKNVLVLNGDTLFEVNNNLLFETHDKNNADCTLVLKPMTDFNRYGCVTTNEQLQIISFEEKKQTEKGLINGGVYLINNDRFSDITFDKKFSFEKDYLEKYVHSYKMMAIINDGYFIDIGIPEDFKKANEEIKIKYHDTISGDK
jgi:D-glycero-alpha-D-manno-heptose 1-phosphate guanylyltransferase